MKMRTQIFLAILIIVKLILGSIFLYHTGLGPLFVDSDAMAAEQKKEPEKTEKKEEKIAKEETIDLEFLIKRKSELEKEEKQISKKKAELLTIQDDINKKIEKLSQLRNEIRTEKTQKKTAEEQKFKHLIKAYAAMKPQSAAGLVEKLDLNLAIELLSKMKGDDAGKILSFVKLEKAAKISEGLVKQN